MRKFDRYVVSRRHERATNAGAEIDALREGHMSWARSISPTHLVTFNFHENYEVTKAHQILDSAYAMTLGRIYGKRCSQLPVEKMVLMCGYTEFSAAGHVHVHALTRFPGSIQDQFLRGIGHRFKKMVPTSTFDVRELRDAAEDVSRVSQYITKDRRYQWWVPDTVKPWAQPGLTKLH